MAYFEDSILLHHVWPWVVCCSFLSPLRHTGHTKEGTSVLAVADQSLQLPKVSLSLRTQYIW